MKNRILILIIVLLVGIIVISAVITNCLVGVTQSPKPAMLLPEVAISRSSVSIRKPVSAKPVLQATESASQEAAEDRGIEFMPEPLSAGPLVN